MESPSSWKYPLSGVKRNSPGGWQEIHQRYSSVQLWKSGDGSGVLTSNPDFQLPKPENPAGRLGETLLAILDLYGEKGSCPPNARGWGARLKEISKHRRRNIDWRTKKPPKEPNNWQGDNPIVLKTDDMVMKPRWFFRMLLAFRSQALLKIKSWSHSYKFEANGELNHTKTITQPDTVQL